LHKWSRLEHGKEGDPTMNTNIKTWLRKAVAALTAFAFTAAHGAEVVSYYHNDVSGSPILATDASGNVLWKENYQPYGDKLNKQPASASNKIGFHGKPFDDNTGLSYMGARYYNPLLGRFTGIDPAGVNPEEGQTFNRYAYGNNNPYKYVDPDGRTSLFYAAVALAFIWGVGSTIAGIQVQQKGIVQSASTLAQRITEQVSKSNSTTLAEAAPKGNSASSSGNKADGAGNGKSQETEKDGKRFFDKGQRDRAQDRSKDADGDPTCEYCGVKTTNETGNKNSAQTDHVKAWSKGGKTTDDNANNSCASCNASKGAKELGTEWIPPNQR